MKRVCKDCGKVKDSEDMVEMPEYDFDMWLAAKRGFDGATNSLKTNMVMVCLDCYGGDSKKEFPRTVTVFNRSDRNDLFEYIKKINDVVEGTDDHVQNLLDAIEKKAIEVHERMWGSTVTISFAGATGSGRSTLMEAMMRDPMPGFLIIEVNNENHYLRFCKI